MRYQVLGRSGLRVSELALGVMTFGEEWGFGESRDECRRVFDTFTEAGGNFIDTANKYTNGTSERMLSEFVGGERDRFVIATKYTLSMRDGDPNASGNHRKNLVQSVEASLERLATDYVDLLWLHAWDFTTPAEEVMRALDDLVRTGKVLHVGVSDAPAWVVARCNTLAELRGWSRFVGLQIEYSLIERTVERELLPMARSLGLAITPWAALGGGVLTGKYSRGELSDTRRAELNTRRISERNLKIAREVDAVADQLGRSSSQVALNWVRQQRGQIIPIVGARKAAQLQDSLGCLDFELSRDQLKRLHEASAIELGFPHDFYARERIQYIVYGDLGPLIDRELP
jgi:aryl-alcohol dehydrogenase-like predicted oxidoreductase